MLHRHALTPPTMRHKIVVALIAALVLLGLAAEFFVAGSAAVFESLFYLALLGFVLGLLRVLIPPR